MKRQLYKINRGNDDLQIGFANATLKVITFDKLFEFINNPSNLNVSSCECENDKILSQLENEILDCCL